ncbi:myelin-associated glycoprotein-like [Colossoma macropomum]|uniref:myelin-associated glycoprotein-like n=1 Tax=Colossoma macropomum TaxID=42526 RepID=UPI001864C369|nr:myelin-associated glycoprotein-like [Colossoma macropomum]
MPPPQNVSISQRPLHVLEGQSLTLSCLSHAFPEVLSYSWYLVYEDREVQLSERSERLHLQVVGRHMGPYRCSAHNEIDQSRSTSTLVRVDFAPVISPDSSCTLEKGQVRCECVVESYPLAAVTWTAPGVQINRTVSMEFSGSLKSTLTGHMGNGQDHLITCHAANKYGQISLQLTLKGSSASSMSSLAAAGCGGAALVLLIAAILYCTQRSRENINPLVEVELKDNEQEKGDTKYSRTMWF